MDLEKGPLQTILGNENKSQKVELVLKQEDNEDEITIDFKALWEKITKEKTIIALTTVGALLLAIILGLGYLVGGADYKGTASTIISFNFNGIDKGLDPRGKTFDISEVKNAEILDKTITELELVKKGITVDGLKRNISISGIMPADVMEKTLLINRMAEKDPTQLEKLNELEYHPTEYKIDLRIPKEFKVSEAKSREILDAITSNYKDYFVDKYSDRQTLNTAISTIDAKKYDYPEFVMLAEDQLKIIKNYLQIKQTQSMDFRAGSTQMTFGDLLAQLEVLQNVELNRIQALVNNFNLTKDADKLMAIYQNQIAQMEVVAKQKGEEAQSTRQQADTYKKDTNVMLMQGTGTTEPLEMTQNSKTYDNLVEQSTRAANEAIGKKYGIEYYKTLITKLQENRIANTPVDNINSVKYVKEVETQIEALSGSMKNFISLTNQTVDDYFEAEIFKDAVKINVPASFASTFNETFKTGILIVVGVTFLGLVIGVFVAIFKKNDNEN
ncbi:MAG: hypothetical protein AB9856_14950 [Cellulosilyticaceae bacterium]